MERVLQKVAEETARANKFLHKHSMAKIEGLLTKHLVEEQMERFTAVCGEFVRAENIKGTKTIKLLLSSEWNILQTCGICTFF